MLFSKLIEIVKLGESGLKDFSQSMNPNITEAASLEKAKASQISFIEKGSYLSKHLDNTLASALIIPIDESLKTKLTKENIAWLSVKDPRIAFAEILDVFSPKIQQAIGIHKSAVIANNVELGEGVSVGPHVYIDEDSKVGDKVIIHPGVIIHKSVVIGKGCELLANCVIHSDSQLGENCIINSNAVIGSEGFGFIPTSNGWRKMPQTGRVILEKDVEVGSSTTIDRPVVGETFIGEGTKIDNLVQIGHGVKVGKNCAFASQVGIAGGAQIGEGVILAGQVGVANRVNVGSKVIASSKCGIHTDIESGQIISGFPALPNKLWLRCSANFKRLPELAKAIRKINPSL